MPEDTTNLVLGHLRAIRDELHEMRQEQPEPRVRLGAVERAPVSIDRRLGLIEA